MGPGDLRTTEVTDTVGRPQQMILISGTEEILRDLCHRDMEALDAIDKANQRGCSNTQEGLIIVIISL